MAPDEVAFETGMFLLRKTIAEGLRSGVAPTPVATTEPLPGPTTTTISTPRPEPGPPTPGVEKTTLRLVGTVPPEIWNRLGTRILPKLRSGSELTIGLEFAVKVKADVVGSLATELRQILQELGLGDSVRIE